MKAIGLDHRTRELGGLHRATTVNDSMPGIGKETVAVLSTITTGTAIETVTSASMNDTVIMTTAGTEIDNSHRSEPLISGLLRLCCFAVFCRVLPCSPESTLGNTAIFRARHRKQYEHTLAASRTIASLI
jgi:hypothetical protein